MKAIILITTVFLSQFALAGTGGGGVMMKTFSMNNPQIVYHMGQQDGLVRFAYGQLVDQKWQVQKVEMSESELMNDVSVFKALEVSKSLNTWVDLK